MSQAEALLSTLPASETTVYDRNSDIEGRIVVGNDRKITVPDSLKRIAVQYDHNVETVTFDCPRYWDNHDMSKMKVYINYLLPNNQVGSYLAENVTPLGNTMTFTWTIKNTITRNKGNISFLVCVKSTDDEGNESAHWNSELNSDLYVSEGLEANTSVISKHPDIITQLLTRMDEVEAIATIEAMQSYTDEWLEKNHDRILAEIEAKGVTTLATIPDEYEYTYKMADYAARTRANAIVCSTEGETVIVDDSSDDYLRNLHIYGKTTQATTTGAQLFDARKIPTVSNDEVALTNNGDGSFTIRGSGTTTVSFSKSHSYTHAETAKLLRAGSITLTAEKVTRPYMYLSIHNSEGRVLELNTADRTTSTGEILEEWLNDSSVYMIVGFFTGANATITSGTIKPMLYQIGDGTWESFTDGISTPSPDWRQPCMSIEKPAISVYGKNLYEGSHDWSGEWGNASKWGDGGTYNGLPVKVETEFKWSGLYKKINIKAGLTYTFSAFIKSNLDSVIFLTHADNAQTGCLNRNETNIGISPEWSRYSVTFTATEDMYITPRVEKRAEGTDPIYVCGYQLEIGESATKYEPGVDGQHIVASSTIRGIPVSSGGNYTDSNGQQWICDEVDFGRGVYIQRVDTKTFNGDEDWAFNKYSYDTVGLYLFGDYVHDIEQSSYNSRVYCDKLSFQDWGNQTAGNANKIYTTPGYIQVYLADQSITTPEAFKTWVAENPLTVVYQLETPIESSLTAEELKAFAELHSNYPNTTVLNDSGAWVKMEYDADTQTYLENLPKASDEQVERSVDAWLTAHFSSAEEVSF